VAGRHEIHTMWQIGLSSANRLAVASDPNPAQIRTRLNRIENRCLVGTARDFRCFSQRDAGFFKDLPAPGSHEISEIVVESRKTG
jgi:hypothetical protein